MLKYLIEKEFKQFARNSFLPRLVILMPCMMMLVLPWAANFEVKNIGLVVVDHDHSSLSHRLTAKAAASTYFIFQGVEDSYAQAMETVEEADADVILEIPAGFERDLVRDGGANVLIAANAVNGTKGAMGSSYLSGIIEELSLLLNEEAGNGAVVPAVSILPLTKFNPHKDYKVFMLPGIMVMLLTLICCFLPALNIVSEKEVGTIEQINVTPVPKLLFIVAKLIPYWLIGFLVLTLCFVIAWLVYGLIPVGSLLTIYAVALLYVLAVSGFGLVISNYSSTMQQAMFTMFFFVLIFILLSGLYTPVSSMPGWAQAITAVNPLRYFMEVLRQVYLKGSGLEDLLPQIAVICAFAAGSNLWAVWSYKKSG